MSDVENKVYKLDEAKDGEGFTPETWRVWDKEREPQVLITCKHGNNALISGRGDSRDWTIAESGKVTPSVYWKGTCECHIWLTLDGWKK